MLATSRATACYAIICASSRSVSVRVEDLELGASKVPPWHARSNSSDYASARPMPDRWSWSDAPTPPFNILWPEFACLQAAYIDWKSNPCKQKAPRRALSNCLIFLWKNGAGEAIRTLDPNLGNSSGQFSLQQVLTRKTTKNPYSSITYIDTAFRVHTLETPWISVLLLPPCFPGHAAPAWGSRFGRCRAPPP